MNWAITSRTGTITTERKIPTPAPTAGGAVATLSFQNAVTEGGSATGRTLSFSVASAAGQERLVALTSITQDWVNTTFSSVAIDGQAATQVGPYVRRTDGGTPGPLVSFWRAAGTANTSINVTFNIAAGSVFDVRGALWTLNDAGTLLDFATANSSNSDLSLDVDTITGGVVAAAILAYNSSTHTTTWIGLTEAYDGGSLYGNDWISAADLNVASTSTPLTITADLPSDLSGAAVGLSVSFNPAGPPVSYDADTTAWVAAVGSSNVTTPRKALIDALIVGLKADGIWTKLDRLWIFRAENTNSALVDLKGLATATAVNSPTFTPDRGYAGNGSTSYINTNYNPSGSSNFTGNAACFGVWDNTTSPNTGVSPIGVNYFGHYSEGTIHYPDGNSYWRVNTSGAGLVAAYPGSGLFMANRSGPSADQLYRNGSSITSSTTAATAFTTTNFYVGARNNDSGTPTAAAYSTDQIGVVVFGGTLTSTEHGNLYTRLNTYVTATP